MSRSGYSDALDGPEVYLYRGSVMSAIRGKRGQAFLRELAAAMDAMPVKELIAGELVTEDGQCCAIGAVCLARGADVRKVDYECPEDVGVTVGIATCMAAEIEYENDEAAWHPESPSERWIRMRKWVDKHLIARESE